MTTATEPETQQENGQEQQQAVTRREANPQLVVTSEGNSFDYLLDTGKFNHMWRVAQMFSKGALVPQQFRNKPEDCFIVCQMAVRLQCDPFMLMQSMYVVHGRPGMEAKMAIALCNVRGPFTGPIQYRFSGKPGTDEYGCTAYATHKVTGEVCEMTVTMRHAKAEDWVKNSKWANIPDLMLRYRSATWLIRTYAPEVLMGVYTTEELNDTGDIVTANVVDAMEQQAGNGRFSLPGAKAQAAQKAYAAGGESPESGGDNSPPTATPQAGDAGSGEPAAGNGQSEAKSASGGWWEPLVTEMVNAQGCEPKAAAERLDKFCMSLLGHPLTEATAKEQSDLKSHVTAGRVKV